MWQLMELAQSINAKMDTKAQEIKGINSNMEANTQTLRGEMRQMGQCLQAGIMATPRAGTNELGGVQRLSGPRWGRVRKN